MYGLKWKRTENHSWGFARMLCPENLVIKSQRIQFCKKNELKMNWRAISWDKKRIQDI